MIYIIYTSTIDEQDCLSQGAWRPDALAARHRSGLPGRRRPGLGLKMLIFHPQGTGCHLKDDLGCIPLLNRFLRTTHWNRRWSSKQIGCNHQRYLKTVNRSSLAVSAGNGSWSTRFGAIRIQQGKHEFYDYSNLERRKQRRSQPNWTKFWPNRWHLPKLPRGTFNLTSLGIRHGTLFPVTLTGDFNVCIWRFP